MLARLEAVEAFPIAVKPGERLDAGTFTYDSFQTVLVKAVLDGVEGWGESMTRFDPKANSLMVKYLAKEMVGKDFESVASAWGPAWRTLRVRGHTRGIGVEALSGIEIALQDCWGKLTGKRVFDLYGGRVNDEVAVFAGSLFESRGSFAEQVHRAKSAELVGAKVKVGFGVERDREVLSEVRSLWDDGVLIADANGAYDAKEAKEACGAFNGLDLQWFEEPVLSDDMSGYYQLRGSPVKIGAGESWFVGDFEQPVKDHLVQVLEPSVSRCGGIEVAMGVAGLAEKAGIGFSPMNGMNSLVSLAASLQVAAARVNVGVEFNPFPNPLQTDLGEGVGQPKEGKVRVSDRPGLGIDIDVGFVRKHLV